MDQVNRESAFQRAMIDGGRNCRRRLDQCDSRPEEPAETADHRSNDAPAGLASAAPQSWPRVFPGL
jgi:hypothetical protein